MNEPLDSIHVITDRFAELSHEFGVICSFRCELDEGLDRSQRVPDFVRKPAGDGFQRAQAVGSPHQHLRTLEILVERGVIQCNRRVLSHRGQQPEVLVGIHLAASSRPQVAKTDEALLVDEWNTDLSVERLQLVQQRARRSRITDLLQLLADQDGLGA